MVLKKIVQSLILLLIIACTTNAKEVKSEKAIKTLPEKEVKPAPKPTKKEKESKEEKTENNKKKKKEKEENQVEEQKDIYLNFENTELSNFVNYISELKKINLIPDKTLQGQKVSLTIRDPLTVEGAWKVFLTVLEMGGFSIVKKGDVQVIIPKKQKSKQPLPSFLNTPIQNLPESDLNLRYVTFLQNISVADVQGLLKSMLSPEGIVVPYGEVNGMIITDKSYNIKSAMKVINELDQTGLQEAVVVMRLKRANASDIKALFDQLIQKPQRSPLARLLGRQAESSLEYFSPTTRIITEDRTNSLILLGNRKSIKKIEDFVVNHLDTELKEVESPLHIYELQHTDASQIKDILEVVTEPSGEKAKYGAVRGGVKYFKKMNFQVDEDGNRLLVSSTDKQDWRLLKKTIEDLDKPQPQVAIETLIVTVNFDDAKELGGAVRNKKEGQIGKGINFQSPSPKGTQQKGSDQVVQENNLLGNMLAGFTGKLGSTLISFGKSFGENTNIWGAFQAIKTTNNATVLSQPFFTVANKTEASLVVGTDRQVLMEESASGTKGWETHNASTTVKITPQINLDGIIRLKINVVVSDFKSDTGDSGDKYTKTLDTDVSVADGQVLVLGGSVKTKVTENSFKTPILGDIPILGWLFKNKGRSKIKEYLFIFISPTIIKPRTNPGANLYTRMKLHRATSDIDESVETGKTSDPIHNWFFNSKGENYSHKVVDFAKARYQPTTVDIKHDPYYRSTPKKKLKDKLKEDLEIIEEDKEEKLLSQKRQQLKELLSAQPILKEKKTQPEEMKIDSSKREEFKKFLSQTPIMASKKMPQNDSTQITSKKRRELKNLLQNSPSFASNIKINREPVEPQTSRKKKRQPRKLKSRRLA